MHHVKPFTIKFLSRRLDRRVLYLECTGMRAGDGIRRLHMRVT